MGMTLLYGYWGVTSILLFWALIRSAQAVHRARSGLRPPGRGKDCSGDCSIGNRSRHSLLIDAAAATVAERTLGLQWVIWSHGAYMRLLVWFSFQRKRVRTAR